MALSSVQRSIVLVNAEKVFVDNETAGSSASVVDLSALVDPLSGAPLVNAAGANQPMLVLQSSDNDFVYAFGTDPAGTVSLTSGVYVKAFEQEYAQPAAQPGRQYLYLIRVGSSDASVNLFVVKTAG